MKKVVLIVGIAATLGFGNTEAAEWNWKGDIRYRYQSDLTEFPTVTGEHSRDRHRSRVRLGVTPWINEELSGGIQLSTGSASETTSRNQTLSGLFLANPVYLNEYFIDYHPVAYGLDSQINILLGKRAVASTLIVINDLVWDSDLTFEGVTIQYGKDADGKEKEGLSAVAGYYSLQEFDGVQTVLTTPPAGQEKNAILLVGQAAYTGELSNLNYKIGAGYYDYANFAYLIAAPNKPAPNYTGKDFNIVELFGTLDGQITELLPWKVSVQYAVNTAKKDATNINIDDAQRSSYLLEAKIGDAKQVGQWSVNADYIRIERDALTILTDSDRNMGAATNLTGFKVGGNYHLAQNLTLGLTWFQFKTIDDITDESAPTRRIIMADAVVKF
ncbi:MAG: putative porin [Chlorobium sp.]